MNTLRNITKKAVAVGASAVMLATTIAAATALDLSEYPAPFVKNGMADTLIVIGSRAAAEDNLASIDIAGGLQAAAVTPVTEGTATATTITGDAKLIGDGNDMLEIGEQLGSVVETLTDDDLEMLASGTISTSKGTSDYNQILDLDVAPAGSGVVKLAEDNDDNIGTFLYYDQGTPLFRYELEFPGGLDSDVDADGNAHDLEDETLFMLGSYFSIMDTDVSSSTANDMTMELISGDVVATMSEGDKSTFNIDGKKYEVTVLFVDDNGQAKFLINGEATDSLVDGDTDTLSDGLEIGVREVLSQSRGDTGGTLVEFYLGANKLEIVDSSINQSDYQATVEINGENIEDLDADIEGSITGAVNPTEVTINSLVFRLNIDAADGQDLYLHKTDNIRDMLDEPDGMLNKDWDITYEGLTDPGSSHIKLDAKSDQSYKLELTNQKGESYNVDYFDAFSTAANDGVFGDEPTTAGDEDSLIFFERQATGGAVANASTDYLIDEDDYFMVTDVGAAGSADNGDDSYILQFTDVNEDDTEVTFEDASTGEEITSLWTGTLSNLPTAPVTGDIRIGGKDFTYWLYAPTTGNYLLAVDLDNDGSYGGAANVSDVVDFVVKGGGIFTPIADASALQIAFDAENQSTIGLTGASWNFTLTTQSDDLDSSVAQAVNISFTETTDEVDLDSLPSTSGMGTWYRETDSDADIQYAMNAYGTFFAKEDQSDESDSLDITYPLEQLQAIVYVHGADVTKSNSVKQGASVRVNPIGDVSALDTEVRYDQKNMIVVGGPCVNTIAAQLLENPTDCTEGFTAGHAMLKLFNTGKNSALLVAGFNAQDTRGAGKVLKNAADYNLNGMEADVVVSSLTDITVD